MDNSKIWEEVLEKIKENITPISFETWFKPLQIRKIDRDLNIVYIEISADKDVYKRQNSHCIGMRTLSTAAKEFIVKRPREGGQSIKI